MCYYVILSVYECMASFDMRLDSYFVEVDFCKWRHRLDCDKLEGFILFLQFEEARFLCKV